MQIRDITNLLTAVQGFAPQVVTDNTPVSTNIIDCQGMQAVAFLLNLGNLADADATFAVTGVHGSLANLADGVALTDADLIGTLAGTAFTFASDNQTRKVGYRITKRYVRITVTPTGNSGNAPLSCTVVTVPQNLPAA